MTPPKCSSKPGLKFATLAFIQLGCILHNSMVMRRNLVLIFMKWRHKYYNGHSFSLQLSCEDCFPVRYVTCCKCYDILPPFENDSPFSVNRDFPGKFVYT